MAAAKKYQGWTAGEWKEWWERVRFIPDPPLRKVVSLSKDRLLHLAARCDEYEELAKLIEAQLQQPLTAFAMDSGFLTFPWMIERPNSMAKFLEGNYTDDATPAEGGRRKSWGQRRDEL